MSTFTPEEVAEIATGGNLAHNAVYLANHNPVDHPFPRGTDMTKLKEFIRRKYVEKKWYNSAAVHSVKVPAASVSVLLRNLWFI